MKEQGLTLSADEEKQALEALAEHNGVDEKHSWPDGSSRQGKARECPSRI
jgi:hypothetical protein